MSTPRRGILYVVWGTQADAALQRSIQSVRRHHPELPIHVVREEPPDPTRGFQQKTRMGSMTPFESTLFLDADTIVMGNLTFGFEQAERFGLAVCICECPWTRRYGQAEGDQVEYNTGVIFFTRAAQPIFDAWAALEPTTPAKSHWVTLDNKEKGLPYEDQASFAKAIQTHQFNPYVLPMNFNLRPAFHFSFFLPIKIWHDLRDPPPVLETVSGACERGERAVTYVILGK